MNERQRDLFLWLWSRRRKIGRAGVGLRGAGVGALGGLAFALLLSSAGASVPGVHAYDTAGQILSAARLLGLSIPAFAFLGWLTADRVWMAQESQYQALLDAGARVPGRKPQMQPGDRGPAIVVGVVAAVIAVLILSLFVAYW